MSLRMFRLRQFFLVCLIGFLGSEASAQLRCNLKHYSTEDGLSHDGILCITRDSEGFMWFGTWDGITRFDGHNFFTYKARPGDSSSLKNNKIRTIIEDKPGYLWVKTYDNRVYRFDKKTEKFLAVPAVPGDQFNNVIIDRIIPASSGDTWLLTENQGLLCAVNQASSTVPKLYKYDEAKKGNFHLPGDTINFLYEDDQNRVWIGTTKGLTCLMKLNGRYVKVSPGNKNSPIPGYSFTCVQEHQEMIYFGTSQGVLVSFNTHSKVFKTREIAEGIPLNFLCISKSGLLYISTSGRGLMMFNPRNGKINDAEMPGFSSFQSVYEDKSGRLWLEPEKNGVVEYNPQTRQFKLFTQKKDANFTSPNKNYHVFEDANNVLWISMKGGGFGYYNPDKDNIEYFYNKPGAANQQFSNIVTALYTDHTGVMWLSANDGGLNRIIFPAHNFNHTLLVKQSGNKSENEVRSIYEDRDGKLWIGTKAGRIYVFKDGKRIDDIFVNLPETETGSVYTITEGKDGTIWLGTKGRGLLRAEPLESNHLKYKVTRFTADAHDINSISSNLIYSVLEDRKGRLWVGTLGGGLNLLVKQSNRIIFKNSNNSFNNYPIESCNVIRYLEEDSQGRIWIATNEGLVIFNPDEGSPKDYHFSRFYKIPGDRTSLGNNDVQFIHKDHSGQMWIGTFGGGLNKVVSEAGGKLKFKIFTTEDGLPNDIILSMLDDKQGNLWLATENGLSEYDFKQQTFRNYDSYDGLPEPGFSEAACFKTASGKLLFGCIEGYVSFNPATISTPKFNAEMALTNLQIYNKDIIAGLPGSPLKYALNKTRHFTLDYDQDVLSIDYTVLDYRAGHKILYAYKLEGYDKGWHYVKNQDKATYTNLPPGDYVFKVKSLNHDLFKNIPQKSVAITVLPPPWRTRWAYATYVVLALIFIEITRRVVVSMIRLRNKVVVEQKLTELKLRFFTNISHELRTPLTLITSPLEEISRSENLSVKGREYIRVAAKNANRMVRFINQLLDFRKVQSGKMRLKIAEVEMVTLVKEISEYFTELAHEKNIELIISSDIDELYAWVDEEKIDIIIYNLLSNAFKFTPSGKIISIEIKCHPDDEYFTISVTDQGPGVSQEQLPGIFQLFYEGNHAGESNQKGTGIGLALSRELVLNHHGKISAINNPRGGMTFSLELRTGKDHFKPGEVSFTDSSKKEGFIHSGYAEFESKAGSGYEKPTLNSSVVLVVEDNTDLRKFLCNQLSPLYQVKEAADGEEGLKMALSTLPDLILSDVMMPNMDGIQMLDQLKNNEATSHIPVILLTAKSSVKNQIEGLKYGADLYITKPFHTDYILASVENLIKQRKKLFEGLLNSNKKLIRLTPEEVLITSKDEQFLKDTIRIVEESMSDPDFNIDTVAAAIGMGRTTFYKKLKSLTGLAPVEFVRKMRLKRGRQLLEAGENTISEIAYQVGFSSSGYFSTCFKEEFEFSPSEYLKEKKSKKVTENIVV